MNRLFLLLVLLLQPLAAQTISGSATGTVTPAPTIWTLGVTPASWTVAVGATVQLKATLDSNGIPVTTHPVTWTSSAPTIAVVSALGLVTGVTVGSATITASATVGVPAPAPGGVAYFSTNFSDGTTGPFFLPAGQTGTCVASIDVVDTLTHSAHSQKCTVPTGTGGAALNVQFGSGALAGLPLDPTLDKDLFEEVRFVLGTGAVAAIGGNTCPPSVAGQQWKVHFSLYGDVGSAVNGWVMSFLGPCSDGPGIASEAEMWTLNGTDFRWPNSGTPVEGHVYDVIYRYHRVTAQACGTMAVWVDGIQIMNLPCAPYMGTASGSTAGLLFREGAPYLQSGSGPFTVYLLFAQATPYPIGPATASP